MFNLLLADLYALRKNKALRIAILVTAVFSVAVVYVMKYIMDDFYANNYSASMSGSYIFGFCIKDLIYSGIKQLSGFDFINRVLGSGDMLPMIIGVFLSAYITAEFSNGTVKNIISLGYTKTYFYLSKLITISAASVAIVFSSAAAVYIAHCVSFGFGPETQNVLNFMGIFASQLFLLIAFVSIFIMASVLIKRISISIAVCLCIVSFNNILFVLADNLLKAGGTIISCCLTVNILDLAVPYPANNVIVKAILVGLIYFVIFTILGVTLFEKQDINQ